MSIFDTDNPYIVYKMRDGSAEDPYVTLNEPHQVVNGKVKLSEIPDYLTKVQVTDSSSNPLQEIQDGTPSSGQYRVDYSTGYLTFDVSRNGEQITADYKGKGLIYISPDMIWTQLNDNGDVVESLKSVIENGESALGALDDLDAFKYVGDYNPSTIYERHNFVFHNGRSYKCLTDGIQGEEPKKSSPNWQLISAGYGWKGTYNNSSTYEIGDWVVDSTLHNLYISLIDGNSGNPLTDTNSWAKAVSVDDLETAVNNKINEMDSKISEANTAIGDAETATTNANSAANSANTAATNANDAATNAQDVADNTEYVEPYNSSTTYAKNNFVSYLGSSFISLQDGNVGNTPDPNADTTFWAVMAKAGEMSKAEYDTNENGQVDKADDSDMLGGQSPSYYATAQSVTDTDNKIGTLSNLTTTDQSNTVNAINEVNSQLTEATITQTLADTVSVISSDRNTTMQIASLVGKTIINHVPLFDSGLWNFHANVTVNSPSKITLNADGTYQASKIYVNANPNTSYTLNATPLSEGAFIEIRSVAGDGTETKIGTSFTDGAVTANTLSDCEEIVLLCSNNSIGTFSFSNIMINEGSTAQAFTKNVRPIKNPVLFSKGKNLIQPFTHWDLHANATVISPYELELNADGGYQESSLTVQAKSNQSYTLSGTDEVKGYYLVFEIDGNGTSSQIGGTGASTSGSKTFSFTTKSSTKKIKIVASSTEIGTFTFTQPQLELGSTATEFKEYNPSYLVLKSSFYKGDKPYPDPNGNWRNLRATGHMALDGSLGWAFGADYSGFKRVYIPLNDAKVPSKPYVVKPDGSILESHETTDNTTTETDNVAITSSSNLAISLSDSDTGWTDAMTPTADQISAFFNGWIYTGDGTTHSYENLYDSADTTTDVNVCLSRNTHEENGEEGYRLVYELAEKEDVAIESEGKLRLDEGLNQVEMAEAFVVREVASPYYSSSYNYYYINAVDASAYLNYRTNKIIDIYKDGVVDAKSEKFTSDSSSSYGDAWVRISESDYDPTATYEVSYIVLPYQLSAPIDNVDVQFNKSMISVQQGLVDNVTDNARNISVMDKTKANKHQPNFVEPVLFNGYSKISGGVTGYRLDEFGMVHLWLDVTGGSGKITILPSKYRPKNNVKRIIDYNGTGGELTIDINGNVTSNNGTANHNIYVIYPV